MNNYGIKYLYGIFLLCFISSCKQRDANNAPANMNEKPAIFAYHFFDSSVPPQYHRSYSVTVFESGSIFYHVDVYGDTIGKAEHDLIEGQWEILIEQYGKLNAENGKFIGDVTGSSMSELLVYHQNGDTLFYILYDNPDEIPLNIHQLSTTICSYATHLDSLKRLDYTEK